MTKQMTETEKSLLDMAAEFEKRAKTPTNLMTRNEFLITANVFRHLVKIYEKIEQLEIERARLED